MTPTRRRRLRQLLWLYFWLLILEGVLRKWVLPGLASPLLLVRDPIALLAVIWGWPVIRQPKWGKPTIFLLSIGSISFLLAITVGHGDIATALYGSRILLIHLPLIFLYGSLFNRDDVIKFSWTLAWLSIPMTVLLVAQSNLPSTHILNVAPGGEGTAVFTGALDRFRPPAVFSFINGVSLFYTLSCSALFVLLYYSKLDLFKRILLMGVAICLVVALPVSISRSLLA
jgi:hypothetical protein